MQGTDTWETKTGGRRASCFCSFYNKKRYLFSWYARHLLRQDHYCRIMRTAPYMPALLPRSASLKMTLRQAWKAAGV